MRCGRMSGSSAELVVPITRPNCNREGAVKGDKIGRSPASFQDVSGCFKQSADHRELKTRTCWLLGGAGET